MKNIKTIVITGASRGIGAATVNRCSADEKETARFVMVARASKDFEKLIASLRTTYPHHIYVPIEDDLASAEDSQHVLKTIRELNVKIEYLINNAGYTNPQKIEDIDDETFDTTYNVNVKAPLRLIRGLLKAGLRPEIIVNIASTAGMTGRPGWLTYGGSKAAMINISDGLREELKPLGTSVVCLSPGRCATALRKTLAPNEDPNTIMQPEDVANVVALFLSPLGRFIDSQNIVVRQ